MAVVDYPRRQAQLQAYVRESPDGGALVVSGETDIRWLTGLVSSNAAALVTAGGLLLVTDGRYANTAEATGLPVSVNRDVVGTCVAQAQQLGIDAILRSSETPILSELRMTKDADELASLRRACDISTEALAATLRSIRPGESELMIARRLEFEMAQLGADDRSFPSIVAAGENSAVPHHSPTARAVEVGDMLKIDFGAMVQGYHADCTRTFVVGADPTHEQARIYELVQEAARCARAAVAPGVTYAELDASARSVIAEAGYGDEFVHGLGHGVGLDVHEPPLLAAASVGSLARGNVVTIEPGIYLPGKFGVRIEDVCLVGEADAEVLTEYPRELVRIG